MKALAFAVLFSCLLAPIPGLAQSLDSDVSESIGSWNLVCRVDAITDEKRCGVLLHLRHTPEAEPVAALALDGTLGGFEPRVVVGQAAVAVVRLRVDKMPAEASSACRPAPAGSVCEFPALRLSAITEQLAKGNRVLLRIERDDGSTDAAADLSRTAAAFDEFRKRERAEGRAAPEGRRLAAERDEVGREAAERKLEDTRLALDQSQLHRQAALARSRCSGAKAETRVICEDNAERCVRASATTAELQACLSAAETDPEHRERLAAAIAQARERTGQLSPADLAAIRAQVARCWSPTAAIRGAPNLIVELSIEMNEDGTVKFARVVDRARFTSDDLFRAAAESVMRAVLKCSPLRLPPDQFERWKTVPIAFNPRTMR